MKHMMAAAQESSRPRRGLRRFFGLLLTFLALGPCLVLVAGFFAFVHAVDAIVPNGTVRAGGVVALTGGPERIAEAVDLLAAGRADRLLISGVNQSTTASEIARLTPRYRPLFACCIDLGYQATNTLGNAAEIRAWARAHAMKSLIVVTSYYHMPRAVVEIGSALPEAQLYPYPVAGAHPHAGNLWSDANTLRILAFEYVKYLFAVARTRLLPAPADDATVADARGRS